MKIYHEKIIPAEIPITSSVISDGGAGWYHFHPEFELSLVDIGHGVRCVGSSVANYEPLDLTLIGGMVPHSYIAAEHQASQELKIRNIKFMPDFAGSKFFQQPVFTEIRQLLEDAGAGIVFPAGEVHKLIPLFNSFFEADQVSQIFCLCSILDSLSRIPRSKLSLENPVAKSDERNHNVFKYIHNNISDPEKLTLGRVAKIAHMSPGAFSSYFSQRYSRRYISYINELRVNIASNKLIDPRLTITGIAALVGFGNLSNFNRQFLRYKGCTPTEYRAKLKKLTVNRDHSIKKDQV